MTAFNAMKEQHLTRLSQYVPVVARVHGGSHPEFLEVKKVFDQLRSKMQAAGAAKPNLNNEFQALRQITNNYTVPEDVCESYEAVYRMLAELDQAYQG